MEGQEFTQARFGILCSMLDDDDGHRKTVGQSGKQCLQCLESTDRGADDDDFKGGVQMFPLVCKFSLCNLSVFCVSVVNDCYDFFHHRGTENTEAAQRNLINSNYITFRYNLS